MWGDLNTVNLIQRADVSRKVRITQVGYCQARSRREMRVLVTGTDGYIGSILGPTLFANGFDVIGVDCGFYRDGWLYNDDRPRPLTLTMDVRRISAKDVQGFDAVIHLAELSNDPLGELSERHDLRHKPPGLLIPGDGVQGSWCAAFCLYLLLQRLRGCR